MKPTTDVTFPSHASSRQMHAYLRTVPANHEHGGCTAPPCGLPSSCFAPDASGVLLEKLEACMHRNGLADVVVLLIFLDAKGFEVWLITPVIFFELMPASFDILIHS